MVAEIGTYSIRLETVEALVAKTLEQSIFDFGEAILNKDSKRGFGSGFCRSGGRLLLRGLLRRIGFGAVEDELSMTVKPFKGQGEWNPGHAD